MLSTAFDGDTNLDTFKIALVHAIHNVSAEKHLDVDKDLDVSDISVFERKAGVYASPLLVFVVCFCCRSLHFFSFFAILWRCRCDIYICLSARRFEPLSGGWRGDIWPSNPQFFLPLRISFSTLKTTNTEGDHLVCFLCLCGRRNNIVHSFESLQPTIKCSFFSTPFFLEYFDAT